jgi:surface antigen
MKSKVPAIISAAILVVITIPASALNIDFLEKSPVAYFTKEDRDLFDAACSKAFNGTDGSITDWQNSATGHRGSITPLNTYQRSGKTCRAVKFHNEAEGYTSEGTYELCKVTENEGLKGWKLTGAKPQVP